MVQYTCNPSATKCDLFNSQTVIILMKRYDKLGNRGKNLDTIYWNFSIEQFESTLHLANTLKMLMETAVKSGVSLSTVKIGKQKFDGFAIGAIYTV